MPNLSLEFLYRLLIELQQKLQRHRHDGKETQDMSKDIVSIAGSFETGEQAAIKVYFPMTVRVRKIRSHVTKALAATDAGTITGANAIGNSTSGQISLPASTVLDNEASVSPTDNNIVPKDSFYKLTFVKTTAGGKVQVFLEYERILV